MKKKLKWIGLGLVGLILVTVIGFLVWVWITNIAILLGNKVNAERERTNQIKAGDERAGHGRCEDEAGQDGGHDTEGAESR